MSTRTSEGCCTRMMILMLVAQLTVDNASSSGSCSFKPNADLRCSDMPLLCSDIEMVVVQNASGCCLACVENSVCNGSAYESWSNHCYLKVLAANATFSMHRANVTGCVLSKSPTPPSPSGNFPFRNTSLPLQSRVADLVSRLTLQEKILQMTRGGAASNCPAPGIDRLGIAPHVWGTECNSGLGSDDDTFAGTSFPQPLGLAASWDVDLLYNVATAFHIEIRAQHNEDMRNKLVKYHHGINCWSPVINIMRHWAWGRNDETYGECPVLSSVYASAFVKGLQGDDKQYVAATAGCKHFVVHGGPDATRQTFSANVSLRDWATTFLPAFESCVDAGGLGMMCSFNAIRGVPACANHRSMTTWARNQWNYSGYIVSDQGAAYGIMADHHYADNLPLAAAYAVSAGLDLEDANDESHTAFAGLEDAVSMDLLSENAVDTAVSRLFYVRFKTGEFDPAEHNQYRNISTDQIRSVKHLELAKEAATKSFVLLKNSNSTLPLKNGLHKTAVVGPFADCQSCYFGKYSPHMDAADTVSVAKALAAYGNEVIVASGCEDSYKCTDYNRTEVYAAIDSSDICILAIGLGSETETEGKDRSSLSLPGLQNELTTDSIQRAKFKNIPIIVLLFVAGPVDPTLFESADAIIDCIYPGEMAGVAVADTLIGTAVPAGRLPFSWPTRGDDVPPETNYTMAGRTYRYGQQNVYYPFGFGLSYSTFDYITHAVSLPTMATNACHNINVSIAIKNSGGVSADEVVQLYVKWINVEPPVPTPLLSLADFKRVYVPKNEVATVDLQISPRDIAVLTNPRCGVVENSVETQLVGQEPFHISSIASQSECCVECSAMEACEAFTYFTDGQCHLYRAWGLTKHNENATSGEPLSQWTLRPS